MQAGNSIDLRATGAPPGSRRLSFSRHKFLRVAPSSAARANRSGCAEPLRQEEDPDEANSLQPTTIGDLP
jgi:hypothetical protein